MITRWVSLLLARALCLDWRGVRAVEPPYLTLADNLGEPAGLGMCIDLKGWRPVQFTDAQLHSCKPSDGPAGGGSDQQFVPRGGAVVGLADAAGHCLQATSATAGSHIDVPACDAAAPLQQIDWDAGTGKLQLRGTSLCLAAGPRSRAAGVGTASAGSFVARNLRLQPCSATDRTLVEWRVVAASGEPAGEAAGEDPSTETEAPHHCHDGQDNDGDGAADCADPDCASSRMCVSEAAGHARGDRNTETGGECTDGRDNDGDGATDCADPDCGDLCGASDGQDCTLAGFGTMTTASCPAPSKGRRVPATCPEVCAAAFAAWRACAGSAAVIAEADAALDGQLAPFVGLCAATAGGGH